MREPDAGRHALSKVRLFMSGRLAQPAKNLDFAGF
jgi:hypothetical protein